MVAEPVKRVIDECQYTKPVRDAVGSAGSSGDPLHSVLACSFFCFGIGSVRVGATLRCGTANRLATRFRSVAAGAPFTTPADVHDR